MRFPLEVDLDVRAVTQPLVDRIGERLVIEREHGIGLSGRHPERLSHVVPGPIALVVHLFETARTDDRLVRTNVVPALDYLVVRGSRDELVIGLELLDALLDIRVGAAPGTDGRCEVVVGGVAGYVRAARVRSGVGRVRICPSAKEAVEAHRGTAHRHAAEGSVRGGLSGPSKAAVVELITLDVGDHGLRALFEPFLERRGTEPLGHVERAVRHAVGRPRCHSPRDVRAFLTRRLGHRVPSGPIRRLRPVLRAARPYAGKVDSRVHESRCALVRVHLVVGDGAVVISLADRSTGPPLVQVAESAWHSGRRRHQGSEDRIRHVTGYAVVTAYLERVAGVLEAVEDAVGIRHLLTVVAVPVAPALGALVVVVIRVELLQVVPGLVVLRLDPFLPRVPVAVDPIVLSRYSVPDILEAAAPGNVGATATVPAVVAVISANKRHAYHPSTK